ncbi:S8 family serine peptidase [Candidatus Bipolaricaulota bacterium]|nr:S8 family serine peptidase [Candidatus Bipolaricaulota bacterium]
MTKRIFVFGLIGLALILAGCGTLFGPGPKNIANNPIPLTPVDPSAIPAMETLPVRIDGDYIQGEIIVGYRDEASLYQVLSLVNGRIKHQTPQINAALVELSGMSVPEALGRIAWAVRRGELKGIRYAEPNYLRELIEPLPATNPEVMGAILPKVYDPNIDLRPYQWGLDAVRAEEAWNYATGQGIIVAVVDTGVDGLHPDLEGQVIGEWFDAWNLTWISGYDSSWEPVYSSVYQRWFEGSHGTHVAGIIAAKNDGVGVVGLAPAVQILSIRIFSPDPVLAGRTYFVGDYNAAVGIIEAVEYGARVLNNSWGGKGYSQTLKAAIDYALMNGAVFVVSMGNSYLDEVGYPAGYPGVIAVGATNAQDKKVDFSTVGGHISVSAPGDRVLSCVPRWMEQDGTGLPLLYDYWGGTSMAAPHVSALAAMVLERNPTATPYQVKRIIEQTATDIEAPGFDQRTGYGRIDAAHAAQTTTLPGEGASVAVFAVTKSSGFPIPYMDITLRKNGIDRYFGQTDFEGYYHGFFSDWGYGFFLEIEPGIYEVIIGGEDTTLYWWSWMRVANRVTARETVTLGPGMNDPVVLEVNTTLQVTLTWDEPVDLDLAVWEYDPVNGTYVWSTPKTGALWGTFSGDAQTGGSETYTLVVPHWDWDVYLLAIDASNASATATASITVMQNGVTEVYGPYSVQAGGFYPSNTWEGWWENTPHPFFGVTGPGGPVVY